MATVANYMTAPKVKTATTASKQQSNDNYAQAQSAQASFNHQQALPRKPVTANTNPNQTRTLSPLAAGRDVQSSFGQQQQQQSQYQQQQQNAASNQAYGAQPRPTGNQGGQWGNSQSGNQGQQVGTQGVSQWNPSITSTGSMESGGFSGGGGQPVTVYGGGSGGGGRGGGGSNPAYGGGSGAIRDAVSTAASQPKSSSGGGGSSSWQLPVWNPTQGQQQQQQVKPGAPAQHGGGAGNFFNATNPWSDDRSGDNYQHINTLLPVAQFDQNNYQYKSDFDEAQRRWDGEFGRGLNQDAFTQGLSTRQQLSAEEQARVAADQWDRQFGHTQNMDYAGLDQSQQQIDIRGTEVNNTGVYQRGLIDNQGFANDTDRAGQQATGRYQEGLISNAAFANDTDRAGQQATAQYQGGLIQNQAQANSIDQAYKSGLITNEQRNLKLQELTQQQNNTFLNTQLAQQAQQAQYERENNMKMASMNAYGRSQSPSANWSRSWG